MHETRHEWLYSRSQASLRYMQCNLNKYEISRVKTDTFEKTWRFGEFSVILIYFFLFLKKVVVCKIHTSLPFSPLNQQLRAKERAAIETSQFWPWEELEAAKPLEVPRMYTTPVPPDVTRRNSWPSTLQRTLGGLEGWVLWEVSSTVPWSPTGMV